VECALQETTPLDQKRVVEAELAANVVAFLGGDAHTGQLPHGIAERMFDGEPYAADDQHDHEGLNNAADDECSHLSLIRSMESLRQLRKPLCSTDKANIEYRTRNFEL
jgi:hypothetical protein